MNTERSKGLHPEPGDTLRTTCGLGRITYHPEWSASSPWVSYWCGTAGRHFERPDQAAAYFKTRRNTTLQLPKD